MRTLPRSARWFLIAVWTVAAGLLLWVLPQVKVEQIPLLLLGLVVCFGCDYFESEFEVDGKGGIALTITDAAMTFLVGVVGFPGIFSLMFAIAISDLLHRRPWFRNLFNVASQLIAYWGMVAVYQRKRFATRSSTASVNPPRTKNKEQKPRTENYPHPFTRSSCQASRLTRPG